MEFEQIIEGIKKGDIRTLSRAITLAESLRADHREMALQVIEHFGVHHPSFRIGVSGTPGVGKSTFIEQIGLKILAQKPNAKIAVLSIDPSSANTKGSILGDKTRMELLSKESRVFIRPTASSNQPGGLARNTRLAMLLCEAAGFDHIIIESVGVGQGETELSQLTDVFLLLLNPGGGDELQGIKRGIVEEAHFILVNKSDGLLASQAKLTAKEYRNAIHIQSNQLEDMIQTKVFEISAVSGLNLSEFLLELDSFLNERKANGKLNTRREKQTHYWTIKTIKDLLQIELESYAKQIAHQPIDQLPERLAEEWFRERLS